MTMPVAAALDLSRPFSSRYGAPIIRRVDPRIFRLTYFTHCLVCDFCHDQCCEHGVDVDFLHLDTILRHADGLEAYSGIPRERWFVQTREADVELPGGGSTRTRVRNGACVFLKRNGRGCWIHAYCLDHGIDYHELKSLVDCLFPITFADGLLCPADEAADGSLVCAGVGPSLYRGLREELRYYFGPRLVAELDRLEEADAQDGATVG
jgi:hypothetical protein